MVSRFLAIVFVLSISGAVTAFAEGRLERSMTAQGAGLANIPADPASIQSDLRTRLQSSADDAVASGLVGASVAVLHPREGMMLVTSGKADLNRGTNLT